MLQELCQPLGNPLLCLFGSLAKECLTSVPNMLSTVKEVHDFDGTIAEAGDAIPNPLSPIAQDHDFLSMVQTPASSFQVHVAGKGLGLFKRDHVGDAYGPDVDGAIRL